MNTESNEDKTEFSSNTEGEETDLEEDQTTPSITDKIEKFEAERAANAEIVNDSDTNSNSHENSDDDDSDDDLNDDSEDDSDEHNFVPHTSQTYIIPPIKRELTEEEKERINKYRKFKKVNGETYKRVNGFLRKHTYITAREWAIARLCADFTTRSGAEMTFIGENLPELVPFMTDTYTPQAVNQARASFKKKVKKSGATFFYGALCGFFTTDELDDILFESSEVARFLLEIEGTAVDIDDEIDVEDRITDVMRNVAEAASRIRAPKITSSESDNDNEAVNTVEYVTRKERNDADDNSEKNKDLANDSDTLENH